MEEKETEKETEEIIQESQVACCRCELMRLQLVTINPPKGLFLLCMNCGTLQFLPMDIEQLQSSNPEPVTKDRRLGYLG